jgi:hypothetical protein
MSTSQSISTPRPQTAQPRKATPNVTPQKTQKRRASVDLQAVADSSRSVSPAPGLTYELTRRLKQASDSGQKTSDLIRRILEMERGREIDREELYEMVAFLLSQNVLSPLFQR